MGNKPEFYKLKGNDFMKDNAKKFVKNVKEFGNEVKDCVCEFAADTVDYVGDHPMVISIVAFGFLKTLGWGVKLANMSCIDVNKNGVDEIFIGNNVKKLNKSMTIQDWFKYLEEMYNCNWKRKKQLSYLKDRGFID